MTSDHTHHEVCQRKEILLFRFSVPLPKISIVGKNCETVKFHVPNVTHSTRDLNSVVETG
jgi:hypothetical protein